MGCANGLPVRRPTLDQEDGEHVDVEVEVEVEAWPKMASASTSLHPRETRILQSDVVDTCVPLATTPPPSEADVDGDGDADGDRWEALVVADDDAKEDGAEVDDVNASLGPEPRPLFEDPDFPADQSSLGFTRAHLRPLADVQWLRPKDLSGSARLFVDGVAGSDVVQGLLGDCWFLSACAAVARHPLLIEKVLPPGQALHGPAHSGVVEVRLCRFGRWTRVRIDDRLPVLRGRLAFASCADRQEFWVALLEKAYAKLHGSYEALAGGQTLDAFEDLTGGLAEQLRAQALTFRQLRTAFHHGAFVTCARKSLATEALPSHGLVRGHAYTVTELRTVRLRMRGEGQADCADLVRLRNPWADASEWTGAWRDGDSAWQEVDEQSLARLGLTVLPDGEFWMSFADLQREFEEVTVATLGPDFDRDGAVDAPMGQVLVAWDAWQRGLNAGGSRNDIESFARNPQYLLTLTQPDSREGEFPCDAILDETHAQCSVLVGLTQAHRRCHRNRPVKMAAIALLVYKSEDLGPDGRLTAEYLLCVSEVGGSGAFTDRRQVLCRLLLDPGDYVIIPASFHADTEAGFLLRVFARGEAELARLPDAELPAPLSPG